MAFPASTRPKRNLLGILFMCTACTLFPVMNGLVQLLSPRYPSEQLVWARQGSHLVFLGLLFAPSMGLNLVRTGQLKWQILRSIVLMVSTLCFFFGVKHLPLAKAASISFMGPFFVALMACPILGERLSLPRIAAIGVGFMGALVIIRPGSEVFQWASLLILASAFCYAFYQILTRFVGGHDRPETSAFYSALVGTVVLSFYVPRSWQPVESWGDGALMFSLGILGALGHYCVARSLLYAQANLVAPFLYWQMVGSVSVGYMLFGHLPDAMTWLGAAIIIAAGLFTGWRETREKSATRAA
jgi:drug/metabolite transporter (DMT)-like permease